MPATGRVTPDEKSVRKVEAESGTGPPMLFALLTITYKKIGGVNFF
jgi:hypothetical protein